MAESSLDLGAIERALTGEADYPFTTGDARALIARVRAVEAERDALIRTCADWHRKYDEHTAALQKACRAFLHWYAEDSTEFNREVAVDLAVGALDALDEAARPTRAAQGAEAVEALRRATDVLCSYACPCVKKADEPWPHSQECRDARSALDALAAYRATPAVTPRLALDVEVVGYPRATVHPPEVERDRQVVGGADCRRLVLTPERPTAEVRLGPARWVRLLAWATQTDLSAPGGAEGGEG